MFIARPPGSVTRKRLTTVVTNSAAPRRGVETGGSALPRCPREYNARASGRFQQLSSRRHAAGSEPAPRRAATVSEEMRKRFVTRRGFNAQRPTSLGERVGLLNGSRRAAFGEAARLPIFVCKGALQKKAGGDSRASRPRPFLSAFGLTTSGAGP